MNTSSVFKGFTYRCLRVSEVQVAIHSLLSVVILVKPLQRINNNEMNYFTNEDKEIGVRNIEEPYHNPAKKI